MRSYFHIFSISNSHTQAESSNKLLKTISFFGNWRGSQPWTPVWLDRPKAPRSVRCLDGLASVALVAANGDPPLAAPWLSQAQAQLEACQPTGHEHPPRFFNGKSRLVPPIFGGDSTTRVLNTAQITEISAVFPEKHQF